MSSLPSQPEEPRVFKTKDALFNAPGVDAIRAGLSAQMEREFEESLTVAQELSQIKKDTESGQTVLQSLESRMAPAFGLNDQEMLLMQFGGERAKKNGRGGVSVEIGGLGDYEKSLVTTSHEEAERAIGSVSKVINYIDVLQEQAANPTKTHEEILKEKGFSPTRRVWADVQAAGLHELMGSTALATLFPEFQGLPNAEVAILIEKTLASDPKLLAKINRRMKDVATRARDLSHVEVDPELQNLVSEKTRISSEQQEVLDHISHQFEERGHTLTPDQKNDVLRRVNLGDRPDAILRDMRASILTEANIGDKFADIITYQQLVAQDIPEMRAFLRANATVNRSTGAYTPVAGADAAEVTRVAAELANATAAKSRFEGTLRTDPDLNDQLQKFADLSGFMNLSRDGGTLTGPLFQEIQRLGNSRQELKRVETSIAQKSAEAGKKEKASLRTRLAEEGELIDEIDTIVTSSIKDVLVDRLKDLDQVELVRLKEAEEKAKEKGEEDVAAAIHRIAQRSKDHWVSYDESTRKRSVDKDEMASDMRTLAYQGEDGVKRLILRDLTGTGDGAIAARGTGADEIMWESVDLETGLSDEQKAIVNKIYTDQGNFYKEKLMRDYFASRNLGNRIGDFLGTGSMTLKDHEWRLLEQNFGAMLEARLKESPEAQKILKQLQERGVAPDSKKKWYLFMILGVLGAAGLAVLGAPVLAGGAAGVSGVGGLINKKRGYAT